MNTLRVCATVGLGLSLALGSGCKSDSTTSGKKDSGPSGPDTRRTDGPPNTNPQADGPSDCVYNGTSYRPGQTFTINCVTFTCQSGGTVTGKGTACSPDAGPIRDAAPTPDLPTNRDTVAPEDARPVDSGPATDSTANKDTQPSEAGTVKDVGGKDTVPDVLVPDTTPTPRDLAEPDLAGSEDVAPPTPDLPVQDEAAVAVTCTYTAGQTYGLGVQFPCGCKTCECDLHVSTGTGIINVVADNCAIDAQ